MPGIPEALLYDAVVVGAGPAGISVVGNLIERNLLPILWIDEAFDGGQINRLYREVPGNLKANRFLPWITAVRPFREMLGGLRDANFSNQAEAEAAYDQVRSIMPDELQQFYQMNPEDEFPLSMAADLFHLMIRKLGDMPDVSKFQGVATESTIDSENQIWTVKMANHENPSSFQSTVQSRRLILCTGSHPHICPLPPKLNDLPSIPLEIALSPTKLSSLLSQQNKRITIAVIGASHSAVLVLKNLVDLAQLPFIDLHVIWLARHRLKYAQYENGEFLAYDNTGLKGVAAIWARANLEPETMATSEANKVIHPVLYDRCREEAVLHEHLPNADFVVQAVGYRPNMLPQMREALTGELIEPQFDPGSGSFASKGTAVKIPGLYGAGIAFPARVIDPFSGCIELSIGFPAFMRAVKMWIPGWT